MKIGVTISSSAPTTSDNLDAGYLVGYLWSHQPDEVTANWNMHVLVGFDGTDAIWKQITN